MAALGTFLTVAATGTSDVLAGILCASSVLGTGGMVWYQSTALAEWQRQQAEQLSSTFARTHARAIRDGDEAAAAVWAQIREPLASLLTHETDWFRLGVAKSQDLQRWLVYWIKRFPS